MCDSLNFKTITDILQCFGTSYRFKLISLHPTNVTVFSLEVNIYLWQFGNNFIGN